MFVFDIDRWVLAHVQRFTHWTQRTFGIAASTWTRICVALAGVLASLMDKEPTFVLAVVIAACVLPLEHQKYPHGDGRAISWDPVRATARMSFWVLSLLVVPVGALWFLVICIGWYFAASADLPPSESKVRKWLGKLRDSIVPAPPLTGAAGS